MTDRIRIALRRLVASRRRQAVGRSIVEGYARVPLTADELDWSDDLTRRMIDEEPW